MEKARSNGAKRFLGVTGDSGRARAWLVWVGGVRREEAKRRGRVGEEGVEGKRDGQPETTISQPPTGALRQPAPEPDDPVCRRISTPLPLSPEVGHFLTRSQDPPTSSEPYGLRKNLHKGMNSVIKTQENEQQSG
ncbi:uncharacterized protein [Penaeus vannamei]|uniref:uncharacterized protein n=1 Tax=Penaeus vannamei TaxID=6689 RepID=UPI00387F8718